MFRAMACFCLALAATALLLVGGAGGCGSSAVTTSTAGGEAGTILMNGMTDGVHVTSDGLTAPTGLTPGGPAGLVAELDFCRPFFTTTLACEGGGSVNLHGSCMVSSVSLLGKTYHYAGGADFSNCGPSPLNGSLDFQMTLGPIPFSCLYSHECPSCVPEIMEMASSGGSFTIGDATAMGVHATYEGQVCGDALTGTFAELTGTVNGLECALDATGGVPCSGDADGDGIPDAIDNCVNVPNVSKTNTDGDLFGDVCDNCLGLANNDQTDTDGDKIGDACDPCPDVAGVDCPEQPSAGQFVCQGGPPVTTSEPCGKISVCSECTVPDGICGDVSNQCRLLSVCDGPTGCTEGPGDTVCDSTSGYSCFADIGGGTCCRLPTVDESTQCGGATSPSALTTKGLEKPPAPPPAICTSDSECPAGGACVDGKCEAKTCTTDTDCPAGTICFASGFCNLPEPPPVTCTDCVCGDCILQNGEACEPGAVPGGPGTCKDGYECVDCACQPVQGPDPVALCASINSVACDPQTEILNPDAIPNGITLDSDATCLTLFLGGCAETTVEGQVVGCCTPGVCGDLSSFDGGTPPCGLLGLVLNEDGGAACADALGGTCNANGCCEPSGPDCGQSPSCQQAADFCSANPDQCQPNNDPCAAASGGSLMCNGNLETGCCVAASSTKNYCPTDCESNQSVGGHCDQGEFFFGQAVLPDLYCSTTNCPDLGPGFGFYCDSGAPDASTGNDICVAVGGLGAPVTGSCVAGCCEKSAPPPPPPPK
jgi:thrombospondin type 3 repeat protein